MSRDYERGLQNRDQGLCEGTSPRLQAPERGSATPAAAAEPVESEHTGIRWDRVRQIQEALRRGTYFVPADQLADALLRHAGQTRDRFTERMYPAC